MMNSNDISYFLGNTEPVGSLGVVVKEILGQIAITRCLDPSYRGTIADIVGVHTNYRDMCLN
ncbi:MAG: hypothetical protein ABIA21_04130 [Candidatus Aenigmatarchaeota archaeon]